VAPKIAACLIVRDSEAVLERCLASIRPHVDEVSVYDARRRSVERESRLFRSRHKTLMRWRKPLAMLQLS
jgi:hypothetical protein